MIYLKVIALLFLILGALYLVGPQVENPVFSDKISYVPADLDSLQKWIHKREQALGNVRYDNESKIYFEDSIPQKTDYSVIYFHGFTASGKEGDPVHKMVAHAFDANLYVPRLHGHGLDEEEPMLNFNNEDFWESGKEALEVAKRLGDKIIVLGTSHGGSLGLALANDAQIKALALYAPNIKVFDPKASLLSKPWGLQIARLVKGGNYHFMQTDNEEKKKYWTTKARLESTTQMQKFLDIKMRKSTFQNVKMPGCLGYYYKNDSLQDKVVSVAAMRKMFDQLGTPDSLKYQKAFNEIKEHVLTSYLSNDLYKQVADETIIFLKQILKN